MIPKKTCCFSGHSKIFDKSIRTNIILTAEKLIMQNNVKTFLVGNYGDFDSLAAATIRDLKNKHKIELILIIPYLTKEINTNQEYYNNRYDKIYIADISETTPNKFRILKANEYMINNSDFLICYVNKSYGGAYKAMNYAMKKSKKVINIACRHEFCKNSYKRNL